MKPRNSESVLTQNVEEFKFVAVTDFKNGDFKMETTHENSNDFSMTNFKQENGIEGMSYNNGSSVVNYEDFQLTNEEIDIKPDVSKLDG